MEILPAQTINVKNVNPLLNLLTPLMMLAWLNLIVREIIGEIHQQTIVKNVPLLLLSFLKIIRDA